MGMEWGQRFIIPHEVGMEMKKFLFTGMRRGLITFFGRDKDGDWDHWFFPTHCSPKCECIFSQKN